MPVEEDETAENPPLIDKAPGKDEQDERIAPPTESAENQADPSENEQIDPNTLTEKESEDAQAEEIELPPESTQIPDDPSEDKPIDANTPEEAPRQDAQPPPVKGPTKKVKLDLEGLEAEEEQEKPRPPVSAPHRKPLSPKKRKSAAFGLMLVPLLFLAAWWGYQYARVPKTPIAHTEAPAQKTTPTDESLASTGATDFSSHGLGSFIIPIRTNQNGNERFLKMTLSVVSRDHEASNELRQKILLIRGRVVDLLLEKSLSDVQTLEGRMSLKRDIRDVLNAVLTQGRVERVYFEEFFLL
jgi:flagellar basal body-associated protein FliL